MSPAHCECQHATTCHSAGRARSSNHWSVATPIPSRLSTPFVSLALCQCGEVHPYITAIYHRLPWRIVLGISEVAVQTISPQGHIPAFHSTVHLSAPNLSGSLICVRFNVQVHSHFPQQDKMMSPGISHRAISKPMSSDQSLTGHRYLRSFPFPTFFIAFVRSVMLGSIVATTSSR